MEAQMASAGSLSLPHLSVKMESDLLAAPSVSRCNCCQSESTNNSFKCFDSKKAKQPQHQCQQCQKLFTLGSNGSPEVKTSAKKRKEDPEELKSLSRKCRHCGVANNAPFQYYNNHDRLQPRFKCLSCGKHFQMRLVGSGEDMRLVHTSCDATEPTEPKGFTNASNFTEDQPFDRSLIMIAFNPVGRLQSRVTTSPPESYAPEVDYTPYRWSEDWSCIIVPS